MRRPHVLVLTGAGVSADSGVATFRGAGGLWEGNRVEDVATPEAWRRDPQRVWRFYQLRRAALRQAAPNAAHQALAAFGARLDAAGLEFTLVTQNVDDLHDRAAERAGAPASGPLHMHGELAVLRCERCDERRRDLESLDPERFLPCSACGHERLRPDVVWFGEVPYHLEAIELAVETCTHFLALGTSGVVYPAAGLLARARLRGARTWISSLEPPENLDRRDVYVEGRAAEVVPELLAELTAELAVG